MCTISLDTVVRANRRTILQSKKDSIRFSSSPFVKNGFEVSVSVMGKLCSQNIPAKKIKESFEKAINLYAKEI